MNRPAATFFLFLLASVSPATAQQSQPGSDRQLTITRVQDDEIQLDGRITEAVWLEAPIGSDFVQRDPDDGRPASERTEVRVAYSGSAIYVAVRAFDSQPGRIEAGLGRRDNIASSDRIGVIFDSYDDRRTAFRFVVTPRGTIADGVHLNDRDGYDLSWDPVWAVATSMDDEGWSAEFRIPFTQLRYDPKNSTWGLQVFRTVQRNAETAYWAPYSRTTNGFVSQFGRLTGLDALPSPKGVEIRPTLVGNGLFRPEGTGSLYQPGRRGRLDAGIDVKWGITPNITLDFTANPDFGQVEADPAVVNLTAFETFLPERRPFFVEGRGLLPGNNVFYSRRIGRAPQGGATAPTGGTVERPDVATILGAAKLTGRAGPLGVSVMSALTSAESAILRDASGAVVGRVPVEPLTHYFASRVSRDFRGGSANVSGYFTAVNRRLGDDYPTLRSAAYAMGAQGEYRWKRNEYGVFWWLEGTHVLGSTRALTAAQLSSIRYFQRPDAGHLEVDPDRTSLSGVKLGIETGKNGGAWRYYAGMGRTTPGFEQNDMGFHGRVDSDNFWAGGQYVRNRPLGPFRTFSLGPDASHNRTTGGEVENVWFRPLLFNTTFLNNWTLGINPIALEWNRWSPTALRGGPGLRNDTWHNSFLNLGTDNRRRVAVSLNAGLGGVLDQDGRFGNLGTTVNFRPSDLLTGSVGVSYNFRRDPQEWITRRVVSDSIHYVIGTIRQRTLSFTTRLNWTLSPALSLQFYAQPFVSGGRYSDFREVLDPNARRFADRLRPYGERVTCADELCGVDIDANGSRDFSFADPDFSSRQLRSTTILRWEYRPGSVLYLGWQHGRAASVADGSFRPAADLADLLSEKSDNTVLLKVSYWLSY